MKTPAIEPLTDGEERIMQMLWSLGEGTVNDILDEGDGREPLRHATDPQKTLTP